MKRVIVSKEDLLYNLDIIRKRANGAKIIAMMKGDFYGLSANSASKILYDNGIDFFAVTDTCDAIRLRRNGIDCDILMTSSILAEEELSELIDNDIIITVGSTSAAVLLNGICEKKNKTARVHVCVDTGFGRYGFIYNETDKIAEVYRFFPNIKVEGIFSHFSSSFLKRSFCEEQAKRFVSVIKFLNGIGVEAGMCHMANSCALFKYNDYNFDAVRVGSAFTGRLVIAQNPLKRIGFLETKIDEIKWLPKGFNIGYGNAVKLKAPTRIAVVSVGYGDGVGVERIKGLFRLRDKLRYILSDLKLGRKSGLYATVAGKRAYVIGRVNVSNLILDVTDVDCNAGDICVFNLNTIYFDSNLEKIYK